MLRRNSTRGNQGQTEYYTDFLPNHGRDHATICSACHEDCPRGKRVSGTLLGPPGVAEGGLQREFRPGLGYPFLRSLRPAPRESLPDIFDFFLALGLVQPLHLVARFGP